MVHRLRQLWRWRYAALALALLFAVRTYWQMEPGFETAAAYWLMLFIVIIGALRQFDLLSTSTGFLLIGGFALNAVVTLANGGFMPIDGETPSGIYDPLTSETKLPWLADVLPLKSSLGDWLVGAGLLGFAWVVTRRLKAAT